MKLLLIAALLSFSSATVADSALPGDSVYHVGGIWQTADKQSIALESLAGKPQIIALIFTGCSTACPIMVESMKQIETKIPANRRNEIGFVLVTLTPDTDSPKALKAFAEKKGLGANWQLLKGNDNLVRALSNALNSRYKVVKAGDVAHSNTVTLLNSQGQIQVQTSGTNSGIAPIVAAIEKMQLGTALAPKN